ncbi:hypothetical protein KVR01_012729 [Diaporthe batatas]|uniref:uncharacterized protein n=1 Tax=Diaporthe batatas TaxID=748121 RepID=UPI001D058ABB|nr:uncharacterized protein KVR01_012729 [Diaporthe batatas]KAG8157345.1 hypothetical protein KVR01_012729 [Diaporthe batatas]
MPSGGQFPIEIVDAIIHYLTHGWIGPNAPDQNQPSLFGAFRSWGRIGGASRYATVDRTWQELVERETFAELRLDLGRLKEAGAILNRIPRRQRCVRTIHLNIVLPRHETAAAGGVAAEEKDQNDRLLQDTLVAFVSTLSRWTLRPPVKLTLDAFAPTDRGYRDEGDAPHERLRGPREYSPLELKDSDGVLRCGPVDGITEVDMERNRLIGRRISGAAMCTLLARLPGAKKVSINWWDGRGDPKVRSDLTEALSEITHAMDQFHIVGTYSQLDHHQPAQEPQEPGVKVDELSLALGVLSQRLRYLDIYEVAVSDDLFLHQNLPPEMSPPPHWARLENLGLHYPPVSPSGQRLFYPDPSAADPDQAPIVAGPSVQRRYLVAARSALEMPLLRNMTLVAQLGRQGHWHKFWYHRNPGGRNPAAGVIWTSSSGFVPDDEVLEAWREVPRKHGDGGGLEVEILHDEYAV